MRTGLVSIIIPTYNRVQLLSETLDSIMAQTYPDWECIIIDDGSTDQTERMVAEYTAKDPRFRYSHRPEGSLKGANTCRNYGFEISQGEFINWFDSDDIMYPDFLDKKVGELIADPKLDFCACISEVFLDSNPNLRTVSAPQIYQIENFEQDFLLNGFFMYTPSPLWRKRILTGKLLFDTSLFRSQEADFHFRILAAAPKYKYLPTVLYGIRTGNESISSQAGKSFRAQQSVFTYFDRAFESVVRNNPPQSEMLLRYVFYRQAVIYYNLNAFSKSFKERKQVFSGCYPILNKYRKTAKLPAKQVIKLGLGLFFALFFKRGFAFLYFPEYDKRKNNQKQASGL